MCRIRVRTWRRPTAIPSRARKRWSSRAPAGDGADAEQPARDESDAENRAMDAA